MNAYTEWEGARTRLLHVGGLLLNTSPSGYLERRPVHTLCVEWIGAELASIGQAALHAPLRRSTFVVPSHPEVRDHRYQVYRCHDYSTIFDIPEQLYIGIGRPMDATGMCALSELIHDYLLPRYGLRERHIINLTAQPIPYPETM